LRTAEFLLDQLETELVYAAYSEERLPVNVGLTHAVTVLRALNRSGDGVGAEVRTARTLGGGAHADATEAADEAAARAFEAAFEAAGITAEVTTPAREVAALAADGPAMDEATAKIDETICGSG